MKILRGELLLLYTCNIIKSLLFRPHLTPDQLHNLNNGEIILTHYSRYQKIEDEKQKREHEFRLQQLELENERRREDGEHELNCFTNVNFFRAEYATCSNIFQHR